MRPQCSRTGAASFPGPWAGKRRVPLAADPRFQPALGATRPQEVRERLGRLTVAEAKAAAGRMVGIRKVRDMEACLGELAGGR